MMHAINAKQAGKKEDGNQKTTSLSLLWTQPTNHQSLSLTEWLSMYTLALYKNIHIKEDLIAWSDYSTPLENLLFLSFLKSTTDTKEKPSKPAL